MAGYFPPPPTTDDRADEEPCQLAERGTCTQFSVVAPGQSSRLGFTHFASDPTDPGAPQYLTSSLIRSSPRTRTWESLTFTDIASPVLAVDTSPTRQPGLDCGLSV